MSLKAEEHGRPLSRSVVNWEELPLMLTVSEVARILRVGRTRAYELLLSLPGVVRIGKRYWVLRDKLRRGLEEQAS